MELSKTRFGLNASKDSGSEFSQCMKSHRGKRIAYHYLAIFSGRPDEMEKAQSIYTSNGVIINNSSRYVLLLKRFQRLIVETDGRARKVQ